MSKHICNMTQLLSQGVSNVIAGPIECERVKREANQPVSLGLEFSSYFLRYTIEDISACVCLGLGCLSHNHKSQCDVADRLFALLLFFWQSPLHMVTTF